MSHAPTVTSSFPRRGLSKAVLVYDDLRAAIVDLALKPGAQIDKDAICRRLGVSRQPLADAIARLAEDSLVEVEPQKGTFVARIRIDDVAEAAFVRRALEVATVTAVAADIDEATLKRLDRVLTYQAAALRARDWGEFYLLDVRFHSMLCERLAMRRVAATVDSSRAPMERARRLLVPAVARSTTTLREHRAILAGLAAHDPAAAAKAMGDHLDQVMAEVRRLAVRQPELFEA